METNLEARAVCSVKRRHYLSGNLSTIRMSLFEDMGGYRIDIDISTPTGHSRGYIAMNHTQTVMGDSVERVFEAAGQSGIVTANYGLDTLVDILERKSKRLLSSKVLEGGRK